MLSANSSKYAAQGPSLNIRSGFSRIWYAAR
uniref:Uncharacterized protein n=1 Tax=Arundo donax TaxID=35708 RepID=A0A0A9AYS0_ARUDO